MQAGLLVYNRIPIIKYENVSVVDRFGCAGIELACKTSYPFRRMRNSFLPFNLNMIERLPAKLQYRRRDPGADSLFLHIGFWYQGNGHGRYNLGLGGFGKM